MEWIDATLISRKFWTKTLFSIEVEAEIPRYKAGQFAQLGMYVDGELIKRAYSFVNAPHSSCHEFYLVNVVGGQLSPQLAEIPIGSLLMMADHAGGFFTLDEVPSSEHLLMLSTGTAVGPFLSILRDGSVWQKFSRVTLVQGVRYNQDINYQSLLDEISGPHPYFQFIPLVTREESQSGIAGRIPNVIEAGLLERMIGVELHPKRCQVMICGNPEMVKETRDMLKARGFIRNLRRKPGQLTVENYW
ncbi:MAG: Flavodoxin/ferredoxin--NADP reductase [Candidatus Celerinatantimonas neptuna]|nr:MAG: Flavodoxin/ferredoxin--NADP reductase [Candidatus Celerinatantimonas neptuna]